MYETTKTIPLPSTVFEQISYVHVLYVCIYINQYKVFIRQRIMIQQPSQILQGLHNIHPEQLCYGRNSAGVEYYEFSCVYPILESWYMRYVFIIVVVCC